MTLIWPSLIILHSPTSKLVHTGHSEVVCYSAIDLVGRKDLKKGLAGRASKSKSKSKSKSIAFKSKSKSKSESLKPKSKSKSLEPKSKSKSKSSKN